MGKGKKEKVLVEKDGPVTTVIINRAEVRNAVDEETATALTDAFRAFEADDEALVGVLTGAGGFFCAGADLKELGGGKRRVRSADDEGGMGPTRMLLTKPVIAAVAGHAVAGGLELALWCDMRVVEEGAIFGVFCRRWGVPLIDGGTVRLPRLIGMSTAMDMVLTGRPVGAEEARMMGLANRVVANGKSREEAEKIAHEIAHFPQICMKADRMSMYHQWGHSIESALRTEALGGRDALSKEAVAGAARFAGGKGRHGSFTDT